MTAPENQQEDQAAAAVCAGITAVLSIVAGQDGKVSIREVIKILEQIKQ